MIRKIFGLVMLPGLAGCGGMPPTSDPASARAALESVLETWKSGGTPKSLLDKSPLMNVADYRWEAGFKLTNFKITDSSATSGFDRRYPVELWITSPKGKATQEKAIYNVATSPTLTVVRDPES